MEEKAREWNSDITITNTTEDWAGLGLAGPRSRDILSKLTDTDLSNESFPFLHHRHMTVAGIPVRCLRISYTGELGWEMYIPRKQVKTVYDALLEAGEEFGVGDFGTYALNSMRLEKGFRMWGNEMTTDNNPLEAGLGFFVKMKKEANFIGKEGLQKIKDAGLKRHLVFLFVDADDVDAEGNETIWHEDKVVGMTTSGSYGYTVNKSIAMAYVPPELKAPGTQLEVELLGKRCLATVQKGAPVMIESMRNRPQAKAQQVQA